MFEKLLIILFCSLFLTIFFMIFNLIFESAQPDDVPSSVGDVKGVSGENLVVKSNSEIDRLGTSINCVIKNSELYFLSLFGLLLFHKILC